MTPAELRIARINRGYTIRGLAREIDVPEQSIRRIEGGSRISLPYAKLIADFYGVLVTDLWPVADRTAA